MKKAQRHRGTEAQRPGTSGPDFGRQPGNHLIEQFQPYRDGLLVRAPAKLNLSLLVNGKRPDGFHEVETVMSKVTLFDEISIERGYTAGIELECRGSYPVPEGRGNLAYRACELLLKHCHAEDLPLRVTLTKNIPAGTGLGSASSDAAATLLGVNLFFDLGAGQPALAELAASLGSDVPFFLGGPMAICRGRGEIIIPRQAGEAFAALIILPNVNVSTKDVYENYTPPDKTSYESIRRRVNRCLEKNRIDLLVEMCANTLQESCFELHSELSDLKGAVEALGIGPLCLSGSGSAMFCFLKDHDMEHAIGCIQIIKNRTGCASRIVRNSNW